ncbi:MAG: nucleotidyltransferase domain-containing protein [Bacteroidetes bacterium]|jgi:predicted nucleotidyltransferase|nr:nucleotidyltransferase domain-containing protein [Bacteroidota bacterium]
MDFLTLTKQIVLKHIDSNKYQVFLFGSRAYGNEKFFSDIDIGILGKEAVNSIILADLEAELEESLVPFKVDLVDFNKVSIDFKNQAMQKIIKWN